jgi:hypothetical protein
MIRGEELIMFSERVLKFEVGAFNPDFKGLQPPKRTKITERRRSKRLWYRYRGVTATNPLNEQTRRTRYLSGRSIKR